MNSGQLNIATNFGSLLTPTVIGLRFAIILMSNNPYVTPQTIDARINYSLSGYNILTTNNYMIKIKSLNMVSFTPPNDG